MAVEQTENCGSLAPVAPSFPRAVLFAGVGAVVIAAAVVGAVVLHRGGGNTSTGATIPASVQHPHSATTLPPPALDVVSVTPTSGATNIAFEPTIQISLSAGLSSTSPMPTLSPAIPGTWSRTNPTTLTFQASQNVSPGTKVTVTVPGGTNGIVGGQGQQLTTDYHSSFTINAGSTLRLDQLLAELEYLPVSFVPGAASPTSTLAGPVASSTTALDAEPTTATAISLSPESGSFAWRFSGIPTQLADEWSLGSWNVVTEGAVMAFESDHNLADDGEAGPKVWSTLLQAVASRDVTSRPYDYLIATETEPETLYVWRDGAVVYQTPTNSGVTGAATEQGTWPVYLRYTTTTMSGTNPDGTHYSDPGIPWVSYFNGSDAVHGFIRSEYGFPQSDGCLELPIANSAVVFPMDPIGTLVTVTTGELSSELGAAPPSFLGSPPAAPTTTTTIPKKKPLSTTSTTAPVTTTIPVTTTTKPPATTIPTKTPLSTTSTTAPVTTTIPVTTTSQPTSPPPTG